MPFFKELRRRSRASFRTSDSSNESNDTVPTAKSSSTLNSTNGTLTPSSSVKLNGSSSNLAAMRVLSEANPPPVPQRPTVVPTSNRNSVVVWTLPHPVVPSAGQPLMSCPGFSILRIQRHNAIPNTNFAVRTQSHFNIRQYCGRPVEQFFVHKYFHS
jgi:hypothetical protein